MTANPYEGNPHWSNKSTKEQALDLVARAQENGITWAEVSKALYIHHGHSSAALSLLNKERRVERLADLRGGNSIYVLGMYVDGRRTIPYGAPKTFDTALSNLMDTLKYEGVHRSVKITEYGYSMTLEYIPSPDEHS